MVYGGRFGLFRGSGLKGYSIETSRGYDPEFIIVQTQQYCITYTSLAHVPNSVPGGVRKCQEPLCSCRISRRLDMPGMGMEPFRNPGLCV